MAKGKIVLVCCTIGKTTTAKIKDFGLKIFTLDTYRSESFEDNSNIVWDEFLTQRCFAFDVKKALNTGEEIVIHSSLSPFRAMIWTKLQFGIFTKVEIFDFRKPRKEAMEEANNYSNDDILGVVPYYFQHHSAPEFQQYVAGAERGRAVLLYELNRYEYWRFKS